MFRINAISQAFLVVLLTVGAWAQQPPDPGTSAATPGSGSSIATPSPALQTTRFPRYEISAGDVFDILFIYTPEWNQTVTVQPDGYVTLREIGDVHAQGTTVPDLTGHLTKAYSSILREPKISIILKEFDKPHFIVTGQVGRPGKYELRTDTTLTEAVGIAGGLLTSAKHSQVIVFRRIPERKDWVETRVVDLKKLYAGNISEDLHLRPGDLVFVPQNRLSKVKPFLPISSLSSIYMNPRTF